MMRYLILAWSCLFAWSAAMAEGSARDEPLFHIERSKNANIVQYDARVSPDGTLNPKDPVIAYWIRHAEQGQREKLSWVQRTFAYGFDARRAPDGESAEVELKADIGRTLRVQREAGVFRAVTDIDGKPACLERIFIHSSGKGKSTRIEYIELHGQAVQDGGKRYEKILP